MNGFAGLAVPQQPRLAVGASGAEDRFEAVQLAAMPEHPLHVGEALVPQQDPPIDSCQGSPFALGVDVHVFAAAIEVDPLKVAEVDRVG